MENEEKRVFSWVLILVLILLVALGCNKDDGPVPPKPDVIDRPDPEPDPVNQAPNSFLLLSPETDSTIVNRKPTFSWEQATDPDGDRVTYDLYLDTQENPSTLVAESLGTTSFKVTENLAFETQYYWKVVAKDDKGAATESTRSLIIDIPIKWLSLYDPNNEGGPIAFDYDNDKLTKLEDQLTTFQSAPPKLERLRNSKNVEHEYKYTTSGKQEEVFVQYGEDSHRWNFEYDNSDRIRSIKQERKSNGVILNLRVAVIEYDDAASIHPAQIEFAYEDEGTFRFTLQWEGDNIVEILSEVDYGMGSGFQFEAMVKISYDDNINPYCLVISEQLGLGSFHVLTNTPTRLESLDFDIFKWQSFNNITAYEVFDEQQNINSDDSYYFDYVYGDSDYPISAMSGNGNSNWRYLDE